jgi:hypothetical protein
MKKILLKIIIWVIRKYFTGTIRPVYCNNKVIMYQFKWSADVQKKDTSYKDTLAYIKRLREELFYLDKKLKEIDKSTGRLTDGQTGNYTKTLCENCKKVKKSCGSHLCGYCIDDSIH